MVLHSFTKFRQQETTWIFPPRYASTVGTEDFRSLCFFVFPVSASVRVYCREWKNCRKSTILQFCNRPQKKNCRFAIWQRVRKKVIPVYPLLQSNSVESGISAFGPLHKLISKKVESAVTVAAFSVSIGAAHIGFQLCAFCDILYDILGPYLRDRYRK